MIRQGKWLLLALLSVSVVTLLGFWGYLLDPEHPGVWLWRVLFLWLFFFFIEVNMGGREPSRERLAILNFHRSLIFGLGLVLALGLGLKLAFFSGVLDTDWVPLARRVRGVSWGCGLAIWGNYIPKLLSPWSRDEEPFDWQRVHRFVGWAAMLGGVARILLWLALPVPDARAASLSILIVFCVLILGRKLISVVEHSRRQPPSAHQADDAV